MADPAALTKGTKHASKAASASKVALPSKHDTTKPKRPSTKSKPKTGDAAENAVDKASRSRKDKRFADLTPEAKKAKRREERQRKHLALDAATPAATTTTIDAASSRPPLRARRTPKRRAQQWKLSHPLGGRYTTTTPVLYSADEKHLFLSQGPAIKIFSAKTSLLARTLQHLHPPPTPFPYSPSGAYSAVANYTLDPANPHQLYTLTFAGDLLLWDWTEGTIEGCWKTDLQSSPYLAWCGLHVFPESDSTTTTTTLWTYHESSLRDSSRKAQRQIVALTIPRTPPAATAEERTLTATPVFTFEDNRPRNLVIVDSSTFVLDAGEAFYVGNRAKGSPDWRMRKVSAPGKVLTIDAIARHKKGGTTQGDVAIGDSTGRIFIYHDVLAPAVAASANIVKSKLHWHRSGVGCIKYSKDGTYLISGGRETVLVLWQLATSSQQHLPNLGASIKSIALSPSGATYALLLSDNSVLAISTTELKPRTAIAGIQSRVFQGEAYHKIYKSGGRIKKSHAPTEPTSTTASFRIPLVRNPRAHKQILLAAPASQKGESAYPYLQTFDLSQDRGVAKQAITRTLASMKNTTPDGGRVVEPTVTALAVSGDGTWLASVDEWAAPACDFLDAGAPQPPRSATVAKEVTLRFWRWTAGDAKGKDGNTGSWELVSMIESPHGVDASGAAAAVADLTASPAAHSSAFATVGSDGAVKIWACRARTRAGVAVQKSDMVLWSCRRNIELVKLATATTTTPLDARIAYASDGSVVAASYTDASEDGVVAIIDPVSGAVAQEISALQTGTVFAIAFADRYLFVAGARRVVAWDLVAGSAAWGCQLSALVGRDVALDSNTFVPNIHLAVDSGSAEGKAAAAVAVAVNYPLRGGEKSGWLTRAGNTASAVAVVEVPSFAVVHRRKAGHGVLALCGGGCGDGFLWLDGAANVYSLTVAGSGVGAVAGVSAGGLLDDVYGDVGGLTNAFLEKAVLEEDVAEDEDGDGKVVRSHMLARLFPAPAYASPAVGDVFGRFMEIVGQKALDVDVSRRANTTDAVETARAITAGGEDEDDDEDEEFEDAREGGEDGDGDVDVYADLPVRDFDVIIDVDGQ